MTKKTGLYFVVFCRNNQVETLVKMTKGIVTAQLAALDAATKCLGKDHEEVRGLLKDMNNKEITDNFCLVINDTDGAGSLNLQMFYAEV